MATYSSYFRTVIAKPLVTSYGAVAGQILGYAMTSAEERAAPTQTLDEQVTAFLIGQSSSSSGMSFL